MRRNEIPQNLKIHRNRCGSQQRPPPMLFRNLSSQLKTGAPDRSAVKNGVKTLVVISETFISVFVFQTRSTTEYHLYIQEL